MKLFLALGPGDIVGARQAALAGLAIPGTSIAFSEQIFSLCQSRDIATLAISYNDRRDAVVDGNIKIENRPRILNGGGVRFHFSVLLYALYLAIRARRFGADFAIVDSGTTHYFALSVFWLLRIPVAVNLHNVLWPPEFPPARSIDRVILWLNAKFFRHIAAGAIGVSPACQLQVREIARYRIPFYQYRCQYLSNGFHSAPPYRGGPFRIAFVGRVEVNKGVLDLIDIAEQLQTGSNAEVVFDICGDGGALSRLKTEVDERKVQDRIVVHGRLERDALLEIYRSAHAVIVPTRSDFCEGMPQTCAEAVLSDLPVITSLVSNAFDVIGPACVKAETDNIGSYVCAIIALIERRELYDQLRSECQNLSKQFLDMNQGYAAAVGRLLGELSPTSRGISGGKMEAE
jgi:glycogen(starch) synthase